MRFFDDLLFSPQLAPSCRYWALKNAVAAGTYGGYASMIVTWNLAMAVVSARRNGGIWNSITSADGKLLDEVLPVDYEVSTRNIVGMQAWAWGIGGLFFPAKVFGLFGVVANPVISALGVGNAITNLVLGGKIMGGTDDDAAANGVTFFGSWGILTTLGIGAGIFTGQYVSLIAMWNLASKCRRAILPLTTRPNHRQTSRTLTLGEGFAPPPFCIPSLPFRRSNSADSF